MYILELKTDCNILTFSVFAGKKNKDLIIAAISGKKMGVYVYFDKDFKALYVGKSKDLAERIKQQSNSQGIEKELDWSFLGVIFTDDAHLKEQKLIKELKPTHNKQGNDN
jgi:excinuclease UvrABC nuclease subunit